MLQITRFKSISIENNEPVLIGWYKKERNRKWAKGILTIFYFLSSLLAVSCCIMITPSLIASITHQPLFGLNEKNMQVLSIISFIYSLIFFSFSYISLQGYLTISIAERLIEKHIKDNGNYLNQLVLEKSCDFSWTISFFDKEFFTVKKEKI